MKFSPEGSEITLEASVERFRPAIVPEYVEQPKSAIENCVMISVTDRGIGIEKEHLSRIFDRFYQVAGTDKPIYKGVGLGLNIAKNIVEAHGGAIWAESDGRGRGTWFVFIIPEK